MMKTMTKTATVRPAIRAGFKPTLEDEELDPETEDILFTGVVG